LGLLAIKPWNAYDLSQQAHRSIGRFWPRADSNLYEAAKSLVDHGLARASREFVGRRPRTVYAITPAGRKALARWVPESGKAPVTEFEGLLKVFFAEHGTRGDLLAHLEDTRAGAEDRLEELRRIAESYAAGNAPFPERLAQNSLVFRFGWEQQEHLRRWAEAAIEEVESWPDEPADWPRDPAACLLITLEQADSERRVRSDGVRTKAARRSK
jgi:DNA-binding PadR family transcriptional regulator